MMNLSSIFPKKEPDIATLAAKKDIAGLVKALRYNDIAAGNTDLSTYFLYACSKWLLKESGKLGN
jgi:hypothetical protein